MSNNEHSHFIVPVKYYVGTFIALLFLTFITVFVAQFDFGALNLPIAMFVAFIKASFVAIIFMGLKWDNAFNKIILLSTLLFLGIFILFTFADTFTRGDIEPAEKGIHSIKSPVKPLSAKGAHHGNSDDHH